MTSVSLAAMNDTLVSDPSAPTEILEGLFQQYYSTVDAGSGPVPRSPWVPQFPTLHSIPVLNRLLPAKDDKKQMIEDLLEQQKSCTSYRKWYAISLKLDELLNNNSWKSNPESDFYDYNLIYDNLTEMKNARLSKDYKLLLYVIRTKWIRNLGNMGDINLYRHSYVGTKKLIEEYISECQNSLDYLINDPAVNLEDSYLLGMLIQTRRNIGRTALVLSGGSTFGIFHIGVLVTLLESNLLPRIISGSSAGSIIASILCCHTNEETPELLNGITNKTFYIFGESEHNSPKSSKASSETSTPVPDAFDDPKLGPTGPEEEEGEGEEGATHNSNKFRKLLNHLSHLIKYGTLFDIDGLKETMIRFVGDLTFKEAYNRTGKILNITVSPTSIHEQTRLLNYLTAPNCLIWSAVCASCSLPGFFPSTSIYEKTPRTNEIHEWNNDTSMKFVDGSVDNDLPITRLSEMFNVDNIIACQVNPHVVPILKVSIGNIGGEIENHLSSKFKNFLNNVYDFATCEIIHYLQLLNEMDIYKNLSNKAISILSQNYSGDITILADFKPTDFLKIFENPTPDFLVDFIIRGARASWPKVTVINNHCGVEFALDKAISLLRGRIITQARHTPTKHKKTSSAGGEKPLSHGILKDTTLSAKSAQDAKGNGYYTLVNSPVLNDENSKSHPSTPIKANKSPPAFRRYNTSTDLSRKRGSSSATLSHHGSWSQGSSGPNPLHSGSWSGPSSGSANFQQKQKNKRERGKSTTSLTALAASSKNQVSPGSDDITLINDDDTNEPELSHIKRANSMDNTKSDRKNIRKAKSSVNFYDPGHSSIGKSPAKKTPSKSIRYSESERVPQCKSNPYLDSPVHGVDFEAVKKSVCDQVYNEDKPNLPKMSSANNSLRNSYIGLNRLKDSDLNRSNSSSSFNLKGFFGSTSSEASLYKDLSSTDLRRGAMKDLKRGAQNYIFNSIDTDGDIVDWALERLGSAGDDDEIGIDQSEVDDIRPYTPEYEGTEKEDSDYDTEIEVLRDMEQALHSESESPKHESNEEEGQEQEEEDEGEDEDEEQEEEEEEEEIEDEDEDDTGLDDYLETAGDDKGQDAKEDSVSQGDYDDANTEIETDKDSESEENSIQTSLDFVVGAIRGTGESEKDNEDEEVDPLVSQK